MIFSVDQYLLSLIDVTGSRRVWGSTCCSCIVSCCIQATMEEAEGRHITNKLMLRQLQMLRERMYKGFYLLDTFMYQVLQQHGDNDQVSGYPLSIFCRAKRLCFSTRGMNVSFQVDGVKEVQKMLESLQSIIVDMAEFIVFLKLYPPINREPYDKYLFLENCMLGRLAEMEKIIRFLLQPEPPGAESLQVLPIIGPQEFGKVPWLSISVMMRGCTITSPQLFYIVELLLLQKAVVRSRSELTVHMEDHLLSWSLLMIWF